MARDILRLTASDLALMRGVLDLFAEVFEGFDQYVVNRPDDDYLTALLADDTFIAVAAMEDGALVGAVTAYELKKYEQPRSELYIYDLAVRETARRRGVATALIEYLKPIARARGAWVIFVQADAGDEPPIALYTSLGKREDVHHFDIGVEDDAD